MEVSCLRKRRLPGKAQQLDLFADRTSATTMRANQLRLYWALLEVLRQCGLAGTQLATAQWGRSGSS